MVVHIPAADAMENSDTLWSFCKFPIFVSDENLAPGGPGGIAEALKLKACINIGVGTIAKLFHRGWVNDIIARSQNDCTHFNLFCFFLVFKQHRIGLTGVFASLAIQ